MTEDWNILDLNKSTQRHSDFKWDRSLSEPNLSDSNPILERWSKKFLHEYISIDELKFYRRRNPIDFHTRSNICLYNKNEPITPFGSLKTEYKRRFKQPLLLLRPSLLRKHTTLKLEGRMDTETEHKANYLPYAEEEILKCRPLPTKNSEHLKLCGDIEFFPEYRTSFIEHPLTERSIIIPPKETFKMDNIFDNININKKNITSTEHILDKTKKSTSESILTIDKSTSEKISNFKHKLDSQKFHLKLEDEINNYNMPSEYRSKFIEFPIEKSHSIPQLSSIKFNGKFNCIPEYRENYKFYDCYSKSAPIKKDDNINFFYDKNYITVPEYKEKYKIPDKTVVINKIVSLKNDDNLNDTIKGDYNNIIPEYYENFKDPQIKDKPERGKCRESYLRLKGKIEFNPEYRSTYLNYPRSRPITKKSTSSIRLSNINNNKVSESQLSPHRKFSKSLTTSPNKYIDNNIFDSTINQELPFQCQPEYRKAKREYLIKERSITRKITENDGNIKTINKNFNDPNKKGLLDKKNQQQQQLNKNKFSTKILTSSTKRNDKNLNRTKDDISPQYRLNIDNIDDFNDKFHKSSPKFGRRASIRTTNHNLARDKIKIIECNPKYSSSLTKIQNKKDNNNQITNKQKILPPSKLSHNKHNIINSNINNNNNTITVTNNDDSSFIILEEPCKKSAWMKKSWYEP